MPHAKEIFPRVVLCTRGIRSSALPWNHARTLRLLLLLQGHQKTQKFQVWVNFSPVLL
jgi:hypothetical protein